VDLGLGTHRVRCRVHEDFKWEFQTIPVAKSPEKAVCRSIFLTTWHSILSAELTKTHPSRLFFWWFCPIVMG